MSGRRLLDAIQVLNVAKSVAARHLAVRQRQLDVYTRTSSLTKGLKNQTEGLILTAQAAAALAKRFNEPEHPRPSSPQPRPPVSHQTASPQSDAHRGQTPTDTPPTPAHVASTPTGLTPDEARRAQRQAEFQIPASAAEDSAGDGQISGVNASNPQDVFYQPSTRQSLELSGLPRVKIPKTTGEYQGGTGPGINSDVYHSAVESETKPQSVEEQSELPEEMMKQIFHSPKVARKLSRPGYASLRKDDERQAGPQVGAVQNETPAAPTTSERQAEKEDLEQLAASIAGDIGSSAQEPSMTTSAEVPGEVAYQMMESRVPSSRLGRLWQYGGLATSMAFGAIGEGFRRATGGTQGDSNSIMFSAGNMERMVSKLSKMRGAALKLGQMLSFQDSKMLPEPIAQVLQRVQDRADYMPASQRDKVLAQNLGADWRELFSSFDEVPMAAASIGQVHKAVLKKTGQSVAVKIQYPGVADSIDSDLNNLSILLTASRLLPKGLYLDKTIANARTELAWECDYIREAECAERFRHLLQDDPVFVVPAIIPEASGQQVLTMELLHGIAVTKIKTFTQSQRDWIGTQILRLCLREITEFKYMQTDPNWTNFLYNPQTNKLELLDFGASRAYPSEFIDKYVRTLVAATRHDVKTCHELSIDLGYLTGYESPAMVDAHVTSILTLAEPFVESSPDVYDFRDQTITDRVRGLIPVMLRERLAPPPEETYSLHRKLSGAFLLCARLGSRVRCKELFAEAVRRAELEGLDLGVERSR